MIRFSSSLLFLFLLWSCSSEKGSNLDDSWQELFSGKNLDGWKRLNGDAEFLREDGEVVGISKLGTSNTFLVTEKKFRDFALEFEVLLDTFINSGVQIRSNSTEYMNGKVHGYQIDLDGSSRAWSGGIYDESRRGWLFPMELNAAGGKAFKPLDWNKIYVEAIGPEIKTWVNDVPATFLIDDLTLEGFIGLQIHSVDRAELNQRKIRWKNMRLVENPTARKEGVFPFVVNLRSYDLSEEEKAAGWSWLFDGKNVEDWRGIHQETFPEKEWQVSNGEIILKPDTTTAVHHIDLITKQTFSSFELQLEFNLSKGGNSGIKYFVDEAYDDNPGFGIGLEYQILDDENHADAKQGTNGNRTMGSLYDLIPAAKQESFVRPLGEWNHARIVVYPDQSVEHWLNHRKVLEYRRGTASFQSLIKESKYRDIKNFAGNKQGHLLLQNHGNAVRFRHIKIRTL